MAEHRVVKYKTLFDAQDETIEQFLAEGWWLYGTPFPVQNAIVQIVVKYDSASSKGPIKHMHGSGAGGQRRPGGTGGRA